MGWLVLGLLGTAFLIIAFAPKQQPAKNANQEFREVSGSLGFFGWTWRLLLVGWQALMVWWLCAYVLDVTPVLESVDNEFEQAGATIGLGLSLSLILLFWVGGTVMLGLFALLTRPTRTLVTIIEQGASRKLGAENRLAEPAIEPDAPRSSNEAQKTALCLGIAAAGLVILVALLRQ